MNCMAEQFNQNDKSLRGCVAAVVPCFNPGDQARKTLDRLLTIMNHIIVVDDGCIDGFADSIRDLPVEWITFPQNRGKGHALLAGFQKAIEIEGVSCVVTIDSDGQHDPNEIPRLYESFLSGQLDLLIGAREFERRAVPWRSWVGNKITASLTRLLLRRWIPDTQSGFRLHSRRFVTHILNTTQGGRYETEMEILIHAIQGEFKIQSLPINTIYESHNTGSHFNPLRDSFLIYRTFLSMLWHSRDRE